MSRTAVVILNYNGDKLLRQFLPSVVTLSADAQIIVADNGSTDNSLSILRDEFPSVRVIGLGKNYGFCGGYNRALKMINADAFVLLNSDVNVTPGWLGEMERILYSDPTVGAVQPKILSYSQPDQFEYAGAGGGFIDWLGYPFCRGRVFRHVEKDVHQYDDIRPVFWASGACMMVRAELYHRFHGLDEDFFAHMEEIDLCWKIQRAGYRIVYCGKSTVHHLGAGTLGYGSPGKTYLNFRNNLAMITKHYSTAELCLKLPLRLLLDWLAALVFFAKGQVSHGKAVLRAHGSYIQSLGNILKKRREIHAAYPDYPRDMIFKGILLLHTHLFGKKKVEVEGAGLTG